MKILDKEKGQRPQHEITAIFTVMITSLDNYLKEKSGKNMDKLTKKRYIDVYNAITNLCKSNVYELEMIARQKGAYERSKVEQVVKLLNRYKDDLMPIMDPASKEGQIVSKASSGEEKEVLTLADLFTMFDKDATGNISYTEFTEICKYMGLFLNKEALLDVFSKADQSGTNLIEFEEFRYAMILLKKQIAI